MNTRQLREILEAAEGSDNVAAQNAARAIRWLEAELHRYTAPKACTSGKPETGKPKTGRPDE